MSTEIQSNTQPKLCCNCKHIAKSAIAGPENWKCFAEQNIESREMDLVTGLILVRRWFLTCYDARAAGVQRRENCGPQGRWFEEAPPKFEEVVTTGKPGGFTSRERSSATDLLSQLDSMK